MEFLQCGGIEFFLIFVCYVHVISISIEVKFSVSHFDGYKHSGVYSIFIHNYYRIAWGTKNACDGS